jgi:lipopolysaccharide export system protein LptA
MFAFSIRFLRSAARLTALAAALLATGAHAERADRNKQMVIEAEKEGVQDAQRSVLSFTGNVVITQGTMQIRAERVEVRTLPDGFRTAIAFGVSGRPASYQQKLDTPEESIDGSAERIEFDGKADTVRFIGSGQLRRLRGTAVADEISGALLTWDNTRETFAVRGGAPSPGNPSGRVRAVLAPRAETPASAPAAAAQPNPPPATAPRLQPSRTLGDKR